MTDIVRVLRVLEYVGPREWVERTVEKSVHGTKEIGPGCYIRGATVGNYPEVWGTAPMEVPILTTEMKAAL